MNDKSPKNPVLPENEKGDKLYGAPQTEAEFEALVNEAGNESSGTFVLIAAVVVLFVVGTLMVTKIVLKSNHDTMVEESTQR